MSSEAAQVLSLAASNGREVVMSSPAFPPVVEINARKFFARSQLEFFKKTLVAAAMGSPLPTYEQPSVETFVPFRAGCQELGVSTRTGDRRRQAARATEPAAA